MRRQKAPRAGMWGPAGLGIKRSRWSISWAEKSFILFCHELGCALDVDLARDSVGNYTALEVADWCIGTTLAYCLIFRD